MDITLVLSWPKWAAQQIVADHFGHDGAQANRLSVPVLELSWAKTRLIV
jgi:hypothetical protein